MLKFAVSNLLSHMNRHAKNERNPPSGSWGLFYGFLHSFNKNHSSAIELVTKVFYPIAIWHSSMERIPIPLILFTATLQVAQSHGMTHYTSSWTNCNWFEQNAIDWIFKGYDGIRLVYETYPLGLFSVNPVRKVIVFQSDPLSGKTKCASPFTEKKSGAKTAPALELFHGT